MIASAIIGARLDYCNGLLYGIPEYNLYGEYYTTDNE